MWDTSAHLKFGSDVNAFFAVALQAWAWRQHAFARTCTRCEINFTCAICYCDQKNYANTPLLKAEVKVRISVVAVGNQGLELRRMRSMIGLITVGAYMH